jgi:hypothetical protein
MNRIIIGCARSGVMRDAWEAEAWRAIEIDTEPPLVKGRWHHVGDVLDYIHWQWDIGIFHPPCTYLRSSGLHWNRRTPGREQKTRDAIAFVEKLMNAPIPRICIENPRGCINTRIPSAPKPQWIQPYEFGDDASKCTGLWLKNLPPLVKGPKLRVPGRMVEWPRGSGRMVERWSNQTDSGQNRLGPSDTRAMERAATYPGIARAMAEQWSKLP